jgi:DNA invertase Pin-like site-specific DNA recombinase
MTVNQLVPAAQYLRMSTEHQQYSLENQSTAIQTYAESHGFEVVRTYSDAAKSGIVLKHRIGLRQLLQDVVSGSPGYQAILVYDVSRWGRFQDTDESAHYEFLCKSAGVPVHYCAESFANDGSLPSLIMKALKRTMAGEYSRELSVKVLAGQKRLARLGFKLGGAPGYGLRRMLITSDGVRKQELASGERKSIQNDRVILVPGPANEVQVVKDIYRTLISRKQSLCAIARDLDRKGIKRPGSSGWDWYSVHAVLSHPKYIGCAVYFRTSSQLCTPLVRLPKSEWIVKPNAFEPVIDEVTFAEAQKVLAEGTFQRSDEELLDSLRKLLASERSLSYRLIKKSTDTASPSTYRNRFGSLGRAYELIGYSNPAHMGRVEVRRRIQGMREQLIAKIAAMRPNDVTIVSRGRRWRSRLRLPKGLIVSVLVARSVRTWKETLRWVIDPVKHERKFITLLARLDARNSSILDLHVLPNIDRRRKFPISRGDSWLNRGKQLSDLSRLCEVVARVRLAQAKAIKADSTPRAASQ